MASSRRPTKPRRCAPKAAKATPAVARPSTSKPRAQGKPRAVSSEPATQQPSGLSLKQQLAAMQSWANANASIVDGVAERIGAALGLSPPFAVVVELDRLITRASTSNQVIQLACKRLRSALGPLGQGIDDRSTTGHMLAMIEQLIEDKYWVEHFEKAAHQAVTRMRAALGEVVSTDDATHRGILDNLISITGRTIEALKQASRPAPTAELGSAMDLGISKAIPKPVRELGEVVAALAAPPDDLSAVLPFMKPDDSIRVLRDGHSLTLTATDERGIHSGRPRFRVFCNTCAVVVHSGTTGPQQLIEAHLRSEDVGRPETPTGGSS